jgi:DNA polymerase V
MGEYTHQTSYPIPLFLSSVRAGFPSPADDYIDKKLDLNEYLINHPAATFYCRVSGSSMEGVGIFDGDLLIVDRAVEPRHGNIVIAVVDGELTCKILDTRNRHLLSSNDGIKPITLKNESSIEIEGVVMHSIRSYHVRPC